MCAYVPPKRQHCPPTGFSEGLRDRGFWQQCFTLEQENKVEMPKKVGGQEAGRNVPPEEENKVEIP